MIPHIRKVYIENYKSLGRCAVSLEPFCVLVGPNGAGKSNFIDAISFVQESLAGSIELALKQRAGIGAVRRPTGGRPTHIGIRLSMQLTEDASAEYAFELAAKPAQRYSVSKERCVVKGFFKHDLVFEVRDGTFTREIPGIKPRLASDRFALFAASATDEFRPVYDFLTSMRSYSIVPAKIRVPQEPDPGEYLKKEGDNAAAILKRLAEEKPSPRYERLCRLLSKAVLGVRGVEYRPVGNKETLQFKLDAGLKHPWTFDALNMSDGTLRVLGILLAVYQPNPHAVVAIEEPEATIHPAVSELIVDVLMDAARERQILLSTHSPDILDQKSISDGHIRTVVMDRGETIIAPVSESGRKAMRQRLYTAGELLRAGELQPDMKAAAELTGQLELFRF